jgi:hypothetical protein
MASAIAPVSSPCGTLCGLRPPRSAAPSHASAVQVGASSREAAIAPSLIQAILTKNRNSKGAKVALPLAILLRYVYGRHSSRRTANARHRPQQPRQHCLRSEGGRFRSWLHLLAPQLPVMKISGPAPSHGPKAGMTVGAGLRLALD